MKPEVLTICAFGPYQKKVCLDFSVLSEQPFFLIHGATGAGKTSIFDAICYALYGEAATEARTPRMLRNREAGPEDDTYVDLIFCVRDTHWHIRRNPEYMRKAKRGKGLARQAPEVLLERLENGRAAESWTRDGEVQARIVRLLGFQCKQFRQVVLLPQGEFRRFLMADTSARKEIMKVLFNTEIYQKLEDKLKAKAAEVSKSYEGIAEKQRLYLAEADAKDEGEFMALLKEREQQVSILADRTAALQSRKEASEKERDAARETMAKFTQADRAADELKRWEDTVPKDAEAKALLDRADRAAALLDLAKQLQAARQDAATRGQDLEALRQQGMKLAASRSRAKERFETVQQQKPAHDAERETLIVLQGLLEVAKELEEAKRDAAAKQAAGEKGKQEAAAAKQRLAEMEQQLKAQEQQAEALQKEALAIDSLKLREQNLLAEQEKAAAAATSKSLAQEAAASYGQAARAAETAEKLWQAARAELAHLRELAREARAVLLAENLKEGEPCPVCGATHHPELAKAMTKVVTDKMLEEQERDVSALEQQYQAAAARAQEKAGKLTAAEAKAEALVKQLDEELAKVRAALRDAQEAARMHDSLLKSIECGQQSEARLKEKSAGLERKATDSAAAAAAAAALVQDKQEQLAGRELPAEPQVLMRQYQQREKAWQAAEEAAAAAERDYHDLDTRYHAAPTPACCKATSTRATMRRSRRGRRSAKNSCAVRRRPQTCSRALLSAWRRRALRMRRLMRRHCRAAGAMPATATRCARNSLRTSRPCTRRRRIFLPARRRSRT